MFKQFNKRMLSQLNIMWRDLQGLLQMQGDPYINVKRAGKGVGLSINIAALRRRIGGGSGGGGGAGMAFVKTAPGAVTTVTCFLSTVDNEGTEITVNCSVIGGSGSEKLNAAVPRLIDGSLIFVEQFGVDWWCTQAFIATDDCDCVQPDHVFNSIAVASDEKISFDGVLDGDTFIRHNSADNEVEHTVEGDKVTTW
jgi:hypothetical protein